MDALNAHTARCAQLCIDTLQACPSTQSSPLYTVLTIANTLEFNPATRRQAWVIRGQSHSRRSGVWPTWFARNAAEKPMLYLHRAASSAQLCALSRQTTQRGILCNDIETRPSSWPKGTQPSLPLWLASNPHCMPYDPASGAETQAIILAGLRALYIDGKPGFYYLALHDQDGGSGLTAQDREDALKGMYRVGRTQPCLVTVHLLGAGRAFKQVLDAARLLKKDWGVEAQLWSCPSYTRLAREAGAAERWNRLHPTATRRSCHLRDCLAGDGVPVVAVTGYPQAIVDQLAGYVDARFVALAPGSVGPSLPSACWITVLALKALADEGRMGADVVETAMQQYLLK